MNSQNANEYLHVLAETNLEDIYIQQVFDYYRQCYQANESAQHFVLESGKVTEALRTNALIGFCNRTLGLQLPETRTFEGGSVRGCLRRCRLIKVSGHELFRGCVVFPTIDEYNHIVAAVGYRIAQRVRRWEQPIIHWQKPAPNAFMVDGMVAARQLLYGQA